MEAFREINERCMEIGHSTVLYMYNSGRDTYSAAMCEFKNLDRLWTKRIKPQAKGFKDQAVAMLSNSEFVDPSDDRKRNLLMEFYFGISVVLFGLIGGEYIGAMMSHLYEYSLIELGLLFALPYYYWTHQPELFDDNKSRIYTFGKLLLLGVLFGHIFPARIMNTVPYNFSLLPFVFAALMDPKLESLGLYGNPKKLVGAALSCSAIVSYFSMLIWGSASFIAIFLIFAHATLLYAHFCFMCEATKEQEMNVVHEKFQLYYLLTLYFVQLVLTVISPAAYPDIPCDSPEHHVHMHTEH